MSFLGLQSNSVELMESSVLVCLFPYYHKTVQTLLMKPKQIFDAIHLPILSVVFKIMLDWDYFLVYALMLRIS